MGFQKLHQKYQVKSQTNIESKIADFTVSQLHKRLFILSHVIISKLSQRGLYYYLRA